MLLLNLDTENNTLGTIFDMKYSNPKQYMSLFFILTDNIYHGEVLKLIAILSDLGYISTSHLDSSGFGFEIEYQGWQRIDELQKQKKTKQQGFIAMWFPKDNSMDNVRTAIKDAFSETGYQVSIIDEKQHNNQIVPEILYEIQNSDFVVADLTGNRNGVYYEAGYALGLGKPVILTTDKTKIKDDYNNAPHFDVAQINQIRYENPDDLKKQLFNRITATVGNLKNSTAKIKK